jgi:aspartyl-tRNA(Asn)/glutamyl-tRNA(Gln) amidotransferase subunit C
MIEIDEKMTRQVAYLSRLAITDEEARLFTLQLGQILEYFELLQKIDVQNMAPLAHPFDLPTPLREDVIKPCLVNSEGKPKILDSAPEGVQGGFRVPQIV